MTEGDRAGMTEGIERKGQKGAGQTEGGGADRRGRGADKHAPCSKIPSLGSA